jgi:hypothetical protein
MRGGVADLWKTFRTLRKLPEHSRSDPNSPDLRQNTIFVATLPKSGTEFIWGGIRDATQLVAPDYLADRKFMREYFSGYCNRGEVMSTGVFNSERLLCDRLRRFLPHGYVLGAHAAATHHNLRTLQDAGFRRVTVLIRDPRDSTVSWTHHTRALGPAVRDFHSFIQHLPADYYDWPHASQLALQVRTFLPAAVNWIESWLGAVAQNDGRLEIQIVYFDELRSNPARLFKRVFEFHEVQGCDLSKIEPPRPGVRHFRQGQHDSWRGEFSEADRAFADNLIGDRFERAFERAASRHASLQMAARDERRNDWVAAAQHYITMLRQFGTYRPAWDGLARALGRLGAAGPLTVDSPNPFIVPEAVLARVEQQTDLVRPHG